MPRLNFSQSDSYTLGDTVGEFARRENEALSLYRPLETQMPFHLSYASERVLRGGNQSGKSTSAAAEFASAACGRPLIGIDGKPIRHKFPLNRPLLMWVIGRDEGHIGDTIHRLLFKPGCFDIIRDEITGLWRSFNPKNPRDVERTEQKVPAPPFIPERFYNDRSWSWEDKPSCCFKHVNLLPRPGWDHGTVIKAFSSGAAVKMGDPVDVLWIDEDIANPGYVSEWQARLSKYKGRLWWSAWPKSSNFALLNLSRRAEKQKHKPKPNVSEICLVFTDNPFIDDEEKAKRIEGWEEEGEDVVRSRNLGHFLTDTVSMYPNFSRRVHSCPKEEEIWDDAVDKLIRGRALQVPDDWSRYLIFDPGHALAAALFAAITPPDVTPFTILIYDELYMRMHDAKATAKACKKKMMGRPFQEFIIDGRMARQTAMGFGKTFEQVYIEAFEAESLKSIASGSRFRHGNDNVEFGCGKVRELLNLRADGTPTLRIIWENTPNLQTEFKLYRKALVKDEVVDKPADGQKDHAMDCLRYLAAADLQYVPIPAGMTFMEQDVTWQNFQKWSRQLNQNSAPADDACYLGAGNRGAA